MEQYRCPFCKDLLIEPMSLTCGHNFCEFCLGRWLLQSEPTQCAVCQEVFTSGPRHNFALRETIYQLFPEAYEERFNHRLDKAVDLLHQLVPYIQEKKQQEQIQSAQNYWEEAAQEQPFVFVVVILTAMIIAAFLCLLGAGPREVYITKPVDSWTLLDCMRWLESKGDWTKDTLIPKFASQNIDGKYLMQLSSDDTGNLKEIISNETEEHQQLLQKVFKYISAEGRVPPTNLWEYTRVYTMKSLILSDILCWFPRLGTMLMFMFDYRGSFLPVIHCVTSDMTISTYDTELPPPSYVQYLQFGVRMLVFPLITVYTPFLFTALWTTNPWAMLYICYRAWTASIFDVTTVFCVLKDEVIGIKILKAYCRDFILVNITYFSLYLVSWILPKGLMFIACISLLYLRFSTLPNMHARLFLVLAKKFIEHLQSHTSQEIWVELQEMSYSIRPVFQSFIHYLSHQCLEECKSFAKNAFSVVIKTGSGVYSYFRN